MRWALVPLIVATASQSVAGSTEQYVVKISGNCDKVTAAINAKVSGVQVFEDCLVTFEGNAQDVATVKAIKGVDQVYQNAFLNLDQDNNATDAPTESPTVSPTPAVTTGAPTTAVTTGAPTLPPTGAPTVAVTLKTPLLSWGLDRIDQAKGLSKTSFTQGFTGKGQIVYIMDSGINAAHSAFSGRVKCLGNTVKGENSNDCTDKSGHGSHVAGIAGGLLSGIAYDAELRVVKACNTKCSLLDVILAQKVILNDFKTLAAGKSAVVLAAMSGSASVVVDDLVREMSAKGLLAVVSAGNGGSDACDSSPASLGGMARETTSSVVTVGATDLIDDIYETSNFGPCVDMFAPGMNIVSAAENGSTYWRMKSGTSAAAAHVAGVAATLLEKHAGDKNKAMKELFSSATPNVIRTMEASEQELFQFQNLLVRATEGSTVSPVFEGFVGLRKPELCFPGSAEKNCDKTAKLSSKFGYDLDRQNANAFEGALYMPSKQGKLIAACNSTGHSTLTGNVRGLVLLVSQGAGNCTDALTAEIAQNATVAGLLIAGSPQKAPKNNTFTVPVMYISEENLDTYVNKQGKVIRLGLQDSQNVVVDPQAAPFPTATIPPVTSAPTSPTAPTNAPTRSPTSGKVTKQPTRSPTETFTIYDEEFQSGLCFAEEECLSGYSQAYFAKSPVSRFSTSAASFEFVDLVQVEAGNFSSYCTFNGNYTGKAVWVQADYVAAAYHSSTCTPREMTLALEARGAQIVVFASLSTAAEGQAQAKAEKADNRYLLPDNLEEGAYTFGKFNETKFPGILTYVVEYQLTDAINDILANATSSKVKITLGSNYTGTKDLNAQFFLVMLAGIIVGTATYILCARMEKNSSSVDMSDSMVASKENPRYSGPQA